VKHIIVAIDTTHEFGSLALLNGPELLEEVLLHSPDGFGHVLYEHLGALLDRHLVVLSDVACFAAASGPGSFTGVRVGLAAVKGLAEATGMPVVAVSNLEAMAQFGSLPLRATFLDARRGEIYAAVYDAAGNAVQPEAVLKFSDWVDDLPPGEIEFLCPDFTPFFAALPPGARRTTVPRALASAIGAIAFRRWKTGQAHDPAAVDANYVRRADAELLWKDR
jgi:tRNA threonylcarbamoyladenosine biosynthesis protein TsaB